MSGRPLYEFGAFRLDPSRHALYRDGVETPLTPKMFDLLVILVEARGRTVDKEELLASVWPDAIVEEGSLPRTISRLRLALGEESGNETFIKTVARRGYRFVASVQVVPGGDPVAAAGNDPSPLEPAAPEALSPIEAAWPARVPVLRLVLTGLAIGLLGIGVWLWTGRADARPRSLAVLPFQSLDRDATSEALGFGLADSLITRLANQDALVVRPTSAVSRYAAGNVESMAAGRALAVDAVLEGSVRVVSGQHRVSARLVDVASGRQLWGTTFDETASTLLAVEDRLVARLSAALSIALDARPRHTGAATTNPEAYEAYLRSRFLTFKLTEASYRLARSELMRAIELDPEFARAHQALGYLSVTTVELLAPAREAYPLAKQEVSRALALDPELADAHATMALIHWQFDWDAAAADRAFRRALELDGNNAFARSQYAFFLSAAGRREEALAQAERARSLDPVSVDVGLSSASAYYWARRYAEAADLIARVRSLDSSHWLAAALEGRTLEQQGSIGQALAVYERAVTLEGAQPEVLMDLGRAHARLGHRAEAGQVLRDLEAFSSRAFPAPFQIAVVHAALGERDRAFAALDEALEARSWYMTWLPVDPSLDPVRADPRFAALLQRMRSEP